MLFNQRYTLHSSPGDAKVSSLDGCHPLCLHGHLKLSGQGRPPLLPPLSATKGVSPTGNTFLGDTCRASPRLNSGDFMSLGTIISYKDLIRSHLGRLQVS